jgi:hypothetical protein
VLNRKKLAATWLLPLFLAAAVQPPAASRAPHAHESLTESGGQVAPLRPAPTLRAESPGLPVLSDTRVPDLAGSGTAARAAGATLRSGSDATGSLARADSRSRSVRARHAGYVHLLRAVRGSVPITSSHPPPPAST